MVIEVVKGGLIVDIGLRGLPPCIARRAPPGPRPPALRGQGRSRPRSSSSTRTATTSSSLAVHGSKRPRSEQREAVPRQPQAGRASQVARCRRWSTSAPSSIWAAWTASCTSRSCPGSTSTTRQLRSCTVGDEIDVEVLEVDLDRERISLSLKATQQDPWQEFASDVTGSASWSTAGSPSSCRSVPSSRWARAIEGLVHISEMSAHHVELPEQVVTPGEELWVKIIDVDLQRRRISLSIKQAAEGGIVAEEYQEHFGEHAYDAEGNYIGPSPEVAADEDAAWAEYYASIGEEVPVAEGEVRRGPRRRSQARFRSPRARFRSQARFRSRARFRSPRARFRSQARFRSRRGSGRRGRGSGRERGRRRSYRSVTRPRRMPSSNAWVRSLTPSFR